MGAAGLLEVSPASVWIFSQDDAPITSKQVFRVLESSLVLVGGWCKLRTYQIDEHVESEQVNALLTP